MEHLVPIVFFAGLFTWLIARNHCRTREKLQLAAMERACPRDGLDTPEALT